MTQVGGGAALHHLQLITRSLSLLWAVHDQQIEDLALYNNVDVPSSCPLHRSHNQYHFQVQSITAIITHQQTHSPHVCILQEQHVTPLRASQWQCELCSKKFKTREYIDIHLDNKHRGDVDEVMSNSSSEALATRW